MPDVLESIGRELAPGNAVCNRPLMGAVGDELRSRNADESSVEPLADSNDVWPTAVFVTAVDALPSAPAVHDEFASPRTHRV
jgi:hypothetical protein